MPEFHIDAEEIYKYKEVTGSLDLLIELFHTRLQVEFVRGMVTYSERPIRVLPVLEIPHPLEMYQPDYLRTGVFVLLGYEILFETGNTTLSLLPYAKFEHTVPDDTWQGITQTTIRGGLNFNPSPFVTLKAEVWHAMFPDAEPSQSEA